MPGDELSLAGYQAAAAIQARNSARQGVAVRQEELGNELSFQEFRMATGNGDARLVAALRAALEGLSWKADGRELARVTGWAQSDLSTILARFAA